jgi:hypothetical protein
VAKLSACASDATKRHGPCFELMYKANGNTVNVKLSPEAAPLYWRAAQLYRKLKNPTEPPRQTLENHPVSQGQTGRVQTPGLKQKPGLFSYPRSKPSPKPGQMILTRWFSVYLAVVLK